MRILALVLLLPPLVLAEADIPDSALGQSATSEASMHPDSLRVDYLRLGIVTGVTVGAMVGVQIYQASGWWKNNRAPFHFKEDLTYGRSVDKIGHFYGASAMTFVLSKGLQWANVGPETSLWTGAGGSFIFQTYLEIQDGFSTWGFDRVDFAANIAGALYPVAQHYVPFLRDINLKMSYWPSSMINESGGFGFRGQQHLMFDDYEGQTFWLSLSVNAMLPRSFEPYWPDWLALAVGYGVRDVVTPDPYSIVLIGLDLDLRMIIPQNTWFLKTLGETLNFIHFPMPAVQVSPSVVWYGLYF